MAEPSSQAESQTREQIEARFCHCDINHPVIRVLLNLQIASLPTADTE